MLDYAIDTRTKGSRSNPEVPNPTLWQCDNLHQMTAEKNPGVCPRCGADVTQAPQQRKPYESRS